MMDPIADMLTRIRNAAAVKKAEVVLPLSNIKKEIANILVAEGYISKAEILKVASEKNNSGVFDSLRLVLKYEKGQPKIANLRRISKPGLRVYVDKDNLPTVLNNLGIAILSTSKGLMTNKEARKQKIGGEVLCEIY